MMNMEIRIVRKGDENYPKKMAECSSMPEELYFLGEMPDDDRPAVGIVGARLCSAYGKETAYEFGRILAGRGVQIISGMAVGIDGSAQEGALDGGGKSFAVLASGVDVCYPRSNTTLYNRIRKQGGILSEQPPGTAPIGRLFPSRNRLISALSDIVLVVEAKSRSGSLITVDFALSQGKTVYAVPGRVGDPLSDGCNCLIAQGAGIAYAPEAILSELDMIRDTVSFSESRRRAARFRRAFEKRILKSPRLSDEAKQVFSVLSYEDAAYPDTIAKKTALPLPLIRSALSELFEEHLISERGRDAYIKSAPDLRSGEPVTALRD